MSRVSYAPGVALATALAGPIFSVPLLFAVSYGPVGTGDLLSGIANLLALASVLVFVTVPVGVFLSIIPNLAGSALLAALGKRHAVARNPLVWLGSGALFGALIGWSFVPDPAHPDASLVMAWVGAFCALLCRRGTTWHD